MEAAFEDAMVTGFNDFLSVPAHLPDPDDAHVVAAAIKTQAAVIVTENLKDFPAATLATLNMEAKSADAFIADTIALDEGRAVAAIRRMRGRFKKPEMTAEALLLLMEAAGLLQAADQLRPHVESL
jgi:PIN domain